MPQVTYKKIDGSQQSIDADVGASVMVTAVRNDVGGIVGECGGSMSCGTCHVFVDPAWADKLPAIGAEEGQILDVVAAGRRPESRLACQIEMTPELDGLVVQIPETQM